MKKWMAIPLITILLASCSLGFTEKFYIEQWEIDGYKVIYTRKLGWAGPHYYEYDVYKNGRLISSATRDESDSCKLHFEDNKQHYVCFNLCTGTGQVYTNNKVLLKIQAIDSLVVKGRNGAAFRLTKYQVRKYARMWNKATSNGFNRLGTTYDYEFEVYSGGNVRQFKVQNNYITEDGNWSYQFKWKAVFEEIRKKATVQTINKK